MRRHGGAAKHRPPSRQRSRRVIRTDDVSDKARSVDPRRHRSRNESLDLGAELRDVGRLPRPVPDRRGCRTESLRTRSSRPSAESLPRGRTRQARRGARAAYGRRRPARSVMRDRRSRPARLVHRATAASVSAATICSAGIWSSLSASRLSRRAREQQLGGLDRARGREAGDGGVGERAHDDRAMEESLRGRERR